MYMSLLCMSSAKGTERIPGMIQWYHTVLDLDLAWLGAGLA